MQSLYSIQEVIKIFQTGGSRPILVTCDDLNNWVCKYEKTTLNLFNEYLAHHFACIWGLRSPEIARIRIKLEHIPIEWQKILQPHLFRKDCFGSKFIENSELINVMFLSSFQDYNYRRKIVNKPDFLKIALFDLWLGNEDRNHNNFNMLLEFEGNKIYLLCPIDHVTLFNSVHLQYPIYLLSDDESIINTSLAQALFKTDRKVGEYVDDIIESFYLCSTLCQQKLLNILSSVPASWDIDADQVVQRLEDNIFLDDWKKQCERQFRTLIQQYIIS